MFAIFGRLVSIMGKIHDKQLSNNVGNNAPILLKRSIFGLMHVYNRLLQDVINTITVQAFQRKLHCIAKHCIEENPKWDLMFHRE